MGEKSLNLCLAQSQLRHLRSSVQYCWQTDRKIRPTHSENRLAAIRERDQPTNDVTTPFIVNAPLAIVSGVHKNTKTHVDCVKQRWNDINVGPKFYLGCEFVRL